MIKHFYHYQGLLPHSCSELLAKPEEKSLSKNLRSGVENPPQRLEPV